MSEENENQDVEAVEDGQPLVAGERLAYARREQKIPILDVAKELHLDEHKVRALENNEFDAIGAPVFAKGHLRKYAQLLKVDQADVMSDYFELTRSQGSAPALSVRAKPRQSIAPGPWLILIAVLAAIGTAYWWFMVRVDESGSTDSMDPVVGVVTPLQQASQEAASTEAGDAEPVNETPREAAADASSPVTDDVLQDSASESAELAAPVNAAEMQLRIIYEGDSWTEISDANGRRLFFDLGRAGRTVDLHGEAPFNVLFGDAANVSLLVDGADYQMPPADRRGTVRVTIVRP